MLIRYHIDCCMQHEQARSRLIRLLTGEGRTRTYRYTEPLTGDWGYYFEPAINEWVAFDNRNRDCWVETFKTEDKAREALSDGTELLDN